MYSGIVTHKLVSADMPIHSKIYLRANRVELPVMEKINRITRNCQLLVIFHLFFNRCIMLQIYALLGISMPDSVNCFRNFDCCQ